MYVLILTNVCAILLLIVLGVLFRAGKASFLIAGYNTLPREEKEKIDEKKLCKATGNLCLILGLCWILPSVGIITGTMWLFWTGFAVFILVCCFAGVAYMNTGNRIRKS